MTGHENATQLDLSNRPYRSGLSGTPHTQPISETNMRKTGRVCHVRSGPWWPTPTPQISPPYPHPDETLATCHLTPLSVRPLSSLLFSRMADIGFESGNFGSVYWDLRGRGEVCRPPGTPPVPGGIRSSSIARLVPPGIHSLLGKG